MANAIMNRWSVRGGLASLAIVAATLVSGCAVNSEMTLLWRDPTLAPGSVRNVLVVGIRKDAVRRRKWEDAFVSALTLRGVTATASYRLFPQAPPDTQDVVDAVRTHGYGAILTSLRLPDQTTTAFVPGTVRPEQVASWDYYGRFHSYWVGVQDPGYTETDTIIQLQTDVWAIAPNGGHLVWSGTLRTLESANNQTVEHAVDRNIMPEMEKQGVVPAKSR
jgi:hypothetical protein